MISLCVIILNYRRADLTLGCLESLQDDVAGREDRVVCVVDNGSDDGSADRLALEFRQRGWEHWVRLIRSPVNRGFAAGNNIGFRSADADAYLLLNSDARLTAGAIDVLMSVLAEHPEAGLIGPRLHGPDGAPQVSCFRYRTPVSELLAAASTGVLTRLFRRFDVGLAPGDAPVEPQWISFACVLIRRAVIEQIGEMDEQFFMYFEDIDYCRRARRAGWVVRHDPTARVVHLRGGTSSVKAAMRSRSRIPRYYFEARSRYFAKHYGGTFGLWLTNVLWSVGHGIALLRAALGSRKVRACAHEWRDNWTNWRRPLQPPTVPQGGEL